MNRLFSCILISVGFLTGLRAEDGYRLWLRYDAIPDAGLRQEYCAAAKNIVLATPTGVASPTLVAAREELSTGLRGLLGCEVAISFEKGTAEDPALGAEGYSLASRGT